MTKANVKPLTKAQLKAIASSKGGQRSTTMNLIVLTDNGKVIKSRHGVN